MRGNREILWPILVTKANMASSLSDLVPAGLLERSQDIDCCYLK